MGGTKKNPRGAVASEIPGGVRPMIVDSKCAFQAVNKFLHLRRFRQALAARPSDLRRSLPPFLAPGLGTPSIQFVLGVPVIVGLIRLAVSRPRHAQTP